jgi:capsular exopolysaccharide synthesis family protein
VFQGVSPLLALSVALVAGLIAGIGIALIWDAFDDRLRGEDELEPLTGIPALGELANDKRMFRRGDWLPAASRKRTALNEGLRALRTTLQVLLPQANDVVVLTSVEPGDGKTFVSANLALAWARTGKRVVLVGGDLRNPSLGDYFGDAADGAGLTELLRATAVRKAAPTADAVEANLNRTKFRGLRILPSGTEPWDPADLLALDGLGTILDSLRSLCDIVVIDSPPAFALVDASLLAAHADGAVLVTSVRRTKRKLLVETVHALVGNGVTVLGIVANRSRRRIPKSYSAYYGASRTPGPKAAVASTRTATARQEPDEDDLLPDHDEGIDQPSSRPEDEKV